MDLLLEATFRAERDHFWFRGFRQFVGPLLEEVAAGQPGALLLDCGCGTGVNLTLLRRYGRAIGVDLTMRGLQFGRARGERLLGQADAACLPFPASRFDGLTSFDVLYSLDDEAELAAWREMARVLKPGGWLIVNVAALPILRGNHSVLALERRRYTKRLLLDRLSRSGFAPVRITYTNASLFPLVLATRLAQRLRGFAESAHDATAEIAVPHPLVNGTLSALLSLEARLLKHVSMPVGSSLLCLARKM
ncbi:MAG: class I SAM-dependent methyltransferase [Vicinamibacterales bacterium]